MTSAVVVLQAEPNRCGQDIYMLRVVGEFSISTYTPTQGQLLWNEALCCPRCGEVWGRISMRTAEPAPVAWSFTPRECGGLLLSESFLDYLLLRGPQDLTVTEMELILDEYARCLPQYSGLSARRSTARAPGDRIPSVDEL